MKCIWDHLIPEQGQQVSVGQLAILETSIDQLHVELIDHIRNAVGPNNPTTLLLVSVNVNDLKPL